MVLVGDIEDRTIPFGVNRIRREAGYNMGEKHHHSCYEIIYIAEGGIDFFVRNRTYHTRAGDLILLDSHELHSILYDAREGAERILIMFERSFINGFSSDQTDGFDILSLFKIESKVITLPPVLREGFLSSADSLMLESASLGKGSGLMLKLLLAQLLITIARHLESMGTELRPCRSITHTNVSQIADYIYEHHAEELSLVGLADRFDFNHCYLARIFRQFTGFTVVGYINNVRVTEAARLLHNSRTKVSDVARQVGFNSVTHFGRTFQKIMGISPQKYRSMQTPAKPNGN